MCIGKLKGLEPTGYSAEECYWLEVWQWAFSPEGVVRGWHQTTQLCGADGRASNTCFWSEVQAALVVAVNLLTVDMASTFLSCVVCGHGGLVVFSIVFTEVSFDIIIFTWMTDHTSVMIVFWLCCFYSALFCTARSLCLCCKLPLLSNSAAASVPVFQSAAAAHLPSHIVWPPCISTFTGNCSLGGD